MDENNPKIIRKDEIADRLSLESQLGIDEAEGMTSLLAGRR